MHQKEETENLTTLWFQKSIQNNQSITKTEVCS
jgi:hypothetical protein